VAEAVAGALAQDYSPLEIILSDDCSSDETFGIMQHAARNYRGPHEIVLNRNSINLNIGSHVNKVGGLTRGDFIVLAAGDDVSLPDRVTVLVNAWQSAGAGPALLYSDMSAIDENSAPFDLGNETVDPGPHSIEAMARGAGVLGATTAMTRDIFDRFPPLSPLVIHEDRVLPFRAFLLGGTVIYVDEELVKYRAVGGMSRQIPTTLRDYLMVYTPTNARRTLPDALQRLSDVLYLRPEERHLRHLCEAAIADHESRLDLHASSKWAYELVFLRWLFKGASKLPLLKHYLKLRFVSVFG